MTPFKTTAAKSTGATHVRPAESLVGASRRRRSGCSISRAALWSKSESSDGTRHWMPRWRPRCLPSPSWLSPCRRISSGIRIGTLPMTGCGRRRWYSLPGYAARRCRVCAKALRSRSPTSRAVPSARDRKPPPDDRDMPAVSPISPAVVARRRACWRPAAPRPERRPFAIAHSGGMFHMFYSDAMSRLCSSPQPYTLRG